MPDLGLTAALLTSVRRSPLFQPGRDSVRRGRDAAAVFALDVADSEVPDSAGPVDVPHLDAKTASLLGVDRDDAVVRGMAVHPTCRAVYLSVARGRRR